ncbi:hypothetical protein JNW98_19945 [Streptomyces sp. SCA2-4]|nr:hypothetical protein [Streptomyces huiliensis]
MVCTPLPGDLVLDTATDRLGTVVSADGATVTLRPLCGGADQWETAEYRPADRTDRLRARVIMLNREGR